MKYLQSKRNIYGGWSNTQNTMMAMTALSAYGRKYAAKDGVLDIEIYQSDKEGVESTTSFRTGQGIVLQHDLRNGEKFTFSDKSGKLTGTGNGGCVLIQSVTKYNIMKCTEDK